MSTVQGRLRIAVQKSGRLADRSLDLVRDAGLRVVKGNNDLLYRVENYPIDLLRVRDDDIPTFVADGVCDLGIVGENVLEEARNGGPAAEVRAFAERWEVARLLDAGGRAYREIAAEAQASPTTVVRVARFLKEMPHQGYRLVLDRFKS